MTGASAAVAESIEGPLSYRVAGDATVVVGDKMDEPRGRKGT
jgi:hypothetical protein